MFSSLWLWQFLYGTLKMAHKHWCIDRECFESTRPDPHTPSMAHFHKYTMISRQIQPKKWRNMTKKLKSCCQKWDSNPRPQKWTATWTQRLRPLGHPDLLLLMKQRKHATPQRRVLALALAFTLNRHVPSIAQLVERWTVVGNRAEIHRSLVQIRLEGVHFCFDSNRA